MMSALKQIEIPEPLLEIIMSIYQARHFVFQDPLANSSQRQQNAGSAQGCPLSPYLLVFSYPSQQGLIKTLPPHILSIEMRNSQYTIAGLTHRYDLLR